ncbi:MAG: hypothetical protein ACPLRW_07510 [Moorellales bacterium]
MTAIRRTGQRIGAGSLAFLVGLAALGLLLGLAWVLLRVRGWLW